VHGTEVVVVTRPGEHAGAEADAAVTNVPGCRLAVRTADCAPIGLMAGRQVVGVVHAGWRGLLDGVLERTVSVLRDEFGAGDIRAFLGPRIGPECYEFGPVDLDAVVARYGPMVIGETRDGKPALDLPMAVRASLVLQDIVLDDCGNCTSCMPDKYFSWRARQETGRMATFAWIER
jgi:YfiH family protein